MKYIVKLIFLFSPFLWYGCSKDEVSGSGNNWSKVSCYVNGKYWNDCQIVDFAPGTPNYPHTYKKSYTEALVYFIEDSTQILRLRFVNSCWDQNADSIVSIGMSVNNFMGEGDYKLNASCDRPIWPYDNDLPQYKTNDSCTGRLTITKFDTLTRTISGKFYFDAYANLYVYNQMYYDRIGYKVHVTSGAFSNLPF